MELQLLGPVEATLDGQPIRLGATKQRALLAILALDANATVSVEHLIDGLWGDEPPATAAKMVQLYVSQLRRLMAADDARIVTHGRGYALCVPGDAVDAARFARLVARAEHPNGDGDADGGDGAARAALALWHGAPLADVAGEPFARAEIHRLEELRLRAAELVVEEDLAAGHEEAALAALARLVAEHPLQERLHEQRMLALYRSGRQVEALAAYVEARQLLIADAGVEPGPAMSALHARILSQDPALEWRSIAAAGPASASARPPPPPATPPVVAAAGDARPPPRRRHLTPLRLLLAVPVVLGVAVVVFVVSRLADADHLARIDEGAVGVVDPGRSAITRQYRDIGPGLGSLTSGAGSVWVASTQAGTVTRIRGDGARVERIDVGPAPVALAFAAGSLWVADGEDGTIAQVDPRADRVVHRIAVGNGLRALAADGRALWAATALDGEVVRIDLRSGRVSRRTGVGGQPIALAVGADAVWAATEETGQVARIDRRTGQVLATIDVGEGPTAVAIGGGAVWSANRRDGTVSRIDPATERVTTERVGRAPAVLAVRPDGVWVGDATEGLLRLDVGTGAVTGTVPTGGAPAGLAVVGHDLWVAAAAPLSAHRGGTLRVGRPPIDLDPAVGGYDPAATAVLDLAYEHLTGYARAGGAAGARLVGELAQEVPGPTSDAHRYVFRLRPGIRYADGRPLRASDVRSSMERMLRIQGRTGPELYDAIDGAQTCRLEPAHCDLRAGIATDDPARTITFRLRRPDRELPQQLALPLASVVPAGTPARPARDRPITGTGPYRVTRVVDHRRALLARNPHFQRGPRGRPAGFADRVDVRMAGVTGNVRALERGELDLTSVQAWPAPRLDALRTRVGAQLRSAPYAQTVYAWLNVRRPPFDDVRVRRALNLAVDRRRAVEVFGGPAAGTPSCQVLPAGVPGYRPVCPFTVAPSAAGAWTAPDLARARQMVADAGARGSTVEVWGTHGWRGIAAELAAALRRLGMRSHVRDLHDLGHIMRAAQDDRRHPQIGLGGWIGDFPEPIAFLRPIVGCSSDVRHNPGGVNASRFCDPGIDAAIDRARAAGAGAGRAWQRVEARIADQAPVVPLISGRWDVVTSPRAGNVQFTSQTGPLLDQVWVH